MISALHSFNVQPDLVGDPCYVFAVGGSAFAGFDGVAEHGFKGICIAAGS